ncbi:hypothetical protein OE749_07975 [Aestuariibacter sp. AA17]|uniref:HTH araC/xylS-type domain-containing protein n=1 Tax=Fluctibacter corallii TaxID=2984329 RepID=A0ABT3A7P4_9ALTE|nr:helix-turn-helix domain-containing protein [Aestuariibacter sp. AA17]MCV2884630.1 hypothetical protein [Aestuariibacter sp. AA17]
MIDVGTYYQYFITFMLVAWSIPMFLFWSRYDRFPHQTYLLLSLLCWPVTLLDEAIRAYGGAESWIALAGGFQFLPILICTWLLLGVRQLLYEKPLQKSWRFYLPTVFMLLGEIPYLVLSASDKLALFDAPPVGNLTQYWQHYLPVLFAGFVMLALTVQALEWLSTYHQNLSEQVVDVHFYKFQRVNWGFVLIMLSAFGAIALTALAMFSLGVSSIWLSTINLLYSLTLFLTLITLMERRRYSPSPIDDESLLKQAYSDAYLRDTLRKAEDAIIRQKAYKKIGLRIRQVADSAKVDPVALAVATRSILNRNFRAFIYHYRLEYAKKVLMQTDTKVSSVAKRLGFNSEKFLSGVFIKYIQAMGKDQNDKLEEDVFRQS